MRSHNLKYSFVNNRNFKTYHLVCNLVMFQDKLYKHRSIENVVNVGVLGHKINSLK